MPSLHLCPWTLTTFAFLLLAWWCRKGWRDTLKVAADLRDGWRIALEEWRKAAGLK